MPWSTAASLLKRIRSGEGRWSSRSQRRKDAASQAVVSASTRQSRPWTVAVPSYSVPSSVAAQKERYGSPWWVWSWRTL
ncbi:hypothetical protein DEJ43_28840 [Streptomyces venezuelae ATCC 10712]|nr:hypothetical protein DEJ43_28840 [Streptomyces venezuelae ATCC 10712]